jgi:hypothetical protein
VVPRTNSFPKTSSAKLEEINGTPAKSKVIALRLSTTVAKPLNFLGNLEDDFVA